MTSAELIVDVHHHYMPALLFDRLAAQAGGKRIVTNEISLTLHPSRKDLESHIETMDEAGVTVAILTDQVQVMGAAVARALNDGIAEVERNHPTRFRGAIHLPIRADLHAHVIGERPHTLSQAPNSTAVARKSSGVSLRVTDRWSGGILAEGDGPVKHWLALTRVYATPLIRWLTPWRPGWQWSHCLTPAG